MELFQIDPGLAIWTWIVFGITFLILQKFVFPQIMGSIKNREMTIAQAVTKAEQIEQRLADIEQEKEKMIKETKIQASEILRQTRQQAAVLRKDLIDKAEQDAKAVLNDAKIKIDDEREAMFRSLRSEIADFVCDASEKVIGKSFVKDNDRQWVKELIETV